MKNQCEIIQDLLPRYIDGAVHPYTKTFVSTHLSECHVCNKYVQHIKDLSSYHSKGKLPAAASVSFDAKEFARTVRMWKVRAAIAGISILSVILSIVWYIATIEFE
ncbi:zf-HC2 domain-containing protein [Paenibacillus xerothermodurans]|uniref:zf-HC2 domain-containing protein n=1 Tax=Paenibacillus xerothermodurans TaxID=1977292 RepID=UPI001403D2D0